MRPNQSDTFEIIDWIDDGDLILSQRDTISVFNHNNQSTLIERIDILTPIIKTNVAKSTAFLEMIEFNPEALPIPFAVGTYWVEILPNYCAKYQLVNWVDIDQSGNLTESDIMDLYKLSNPDSGHVYTCNIEEYATGLVSSVVAQECRGRCGNANGDASVGVSDAVYVINYVFVGGDPPLPILACGDANGDASVGVSDAVYLINFVFVGGDFPGDCSPGAWIGQGGDCCPY